MFIGKTIVIKYGGAAMLDMAGECSVMEDVAWLAGSGAVVIIVHGGGPELSALQEKLGIEPRFVDGLRYTDEETIDAALMALCGKVNKDLVRQLENLGVRAAGISGIDGGVLKCVKRREPDLGYVGAIQKVDTGLLDVLLEGDYIPVISTVGIGSDGLAYNINADTAAGRIAAGLSADLFITMTDVPGVLRDVNDRGSVIEKIHVDEVIEMIESGEISGGMIPKVIGIANAVREGAGSAVIINGRVPHALREWAEGAGTGTRIIDGQR